MTSVLPEDGIAVTTFKILPTHPNIVALLPNPIRPGGNFLGSQNLARRTWASDPGAISKC
ncbi:MAG: hypothetical protein ACP5VS_07595 [Desulfomonilaceae bacterium]